MALGSARRARRVQDPNRMLEGHGLEREWLVLRQQRLRRKCCPANRSASPSDAHGAAQTRQRGDDLPNLRRALEHFAAVSVARSRASSTVGSICRKRSSTLLTPNSGAQLDQIAPKLAVAKNAITASPPFGKRPATRSPERTPKRRKPARARATSSASCAKSKSDVHRVRCAPRAPRAHPRRRSACSA